MKIERHQRLGQRKRSAILAGMRQRAKRRAHRTWDDGIDAQVGPAFPFVRQRRGQRRESRLGGRIRSPVGARIVAARVERQHHGSVRGGGEQRQHRARQRHRRAQIDAQHLLPDIEGLVLDRTERAQERRGVHQAVEPSELRADARRRPVRSRPPTRWRDRAGESSAAVRRRRRSRRRSPRACGRRVRAAPRVAPRRAHAIASGRPSPPDAPVTRIARPERSTSTGSRGEGNGIVLGDLGVGERAG